MPAGLRLWYPWRVAQLRRPQPPGDRLERGSLCRPTCRCRSAHQQPTPWKLSCRWSSPGRRDPGSIPTGGAAVIGRTVGGGTWIATDVSGRFLALGALILRHDARATSCVPSGIRSGRMVVGGSDDPDCGVAVQSACRDRSGRETHRVQLLAFLRPLPHQVDRSAERPAPRLRLHSPRARVRLVPSSAACQRPCPADDPVRHASSKGRPQRLDGEDLWATREGLSTFHTPATSSNDAESTGGGPPLAAQRPHRPQTRLPNLQTVTTPRHPPPQTRRP